MDSVGGDRYYAQQSPPGSSSSQRPHQLQQRTIPRRRSYDGGGGPQGAPQLPPLLHPRSSYNNGWSDHGRHYYDGGGDHYASPPIPHYSAGSRDSSRDSSSRPYHHAPSPAASGRSFIHHRMTPNDTTAAVSYHSPHSQQLHDPYHHSQASRAATQQQHHFHRRYSPHHNLPPDENVIIGPTQSPSGHQPFEPRGRSLDARSVDTRDRRGGVSSIAVASTTPGPAGAKSGQKALPSPQASGRQTPPPNPSARRHAALTPLGGGSRHAAAHATEVDCSTTAAASAASGDAAAVSPPAEDAAKTPSLPPVLNFDSWKSLPELRRNKLCLHCRQARWQSTVQPVCTKCAHLLQTAKCAHCGDEFLQYAALQKAQELLARSVCFTCATFVDRFGPDPAECTCCGAWAAFEGDRCLRCRNFRTRYGSPVACARCERRSAFRRETEKLAKVDNLLLCFECTLVHKRERYKVARKAAAANASAAAGGQTAESAAVASAAATGPVTTEKRLREQLECAKKQVADLEAQLEKKDKETVQLVSKLEQENFWLRREAEEQQRIATRAESARSNLAARLTEVERRKDTLLTQTIADSQQERDRLFSVIDELKSKTAQAEEEGRKRQGDAENARQQAEVAEGKYQNYVKAAEKRMQRMLGKILKLTARITERARQKTLMLAESRKTAQKLLEVIEEQRASGPAAGSGSVADGDEATLGSSGGGGWKRPSSSTASETISPKRRGVGTRGRRKVSDAEDAGESSSAAAATQQTATAPATASATRGRSVVARAEPKRRGRGGGKGGRGRGGGVAAALAAAAAAASLEAAAALPEIEPSELRPPPGPPPRTPDDSPPSQAEEVDPLTAAAADPPDITCRGSSTIPTSSLSTSVPSIAGQSTIAVAKTSPPSSPSFESSALVKTTERRQSVVSTNRRDFNDSEADEDNDEDDGDYEPPPLLVQADDDNFRDSD